MTREPPAGDATLEARPRGDADAPASDAELADNQTTLRAYEGYARKYAERTASVDADGSDALRRLAAALAPAASVLEIGSGPGWDADYLEDVLGLRVRRTEPVAAFRDVQAERGKRVDALDLLVDPLGGPYDGVMAMYVLQHVARGRTADVLARIVDALRPGGVFLVALRAGEGEEWEPGDAARAYHVVLRGEAEFDADLGAAGLDIGWRHGFSADSGDWLIRLARKPG